MKANLMGIAQVSILILLSVPALAQKSTLTLSEKQTAYENALLDSAYRYEKLKLAFIPLKTSYEYQTKEVAELRNTVRLQGLQIEMQEQSLAAAIVKEREKTRGKWWRGLLIGLATGLAGGLLIGLKL